MKYKVKTNIDRDGKIYEPGSTIDLRKEDAERIPWAVELPAEKAEKEKAAKAEKAEKEKG